jgi:hypothetical protein
MDKLIKIIPNTIAPTTEVLLDGVAARNSSYVNAQQPNGLGPTQMVTFELPQELLDLRSSTFQFTVTGTAGGGATFTRFNQDIRSIIKRVVIRFANKYVADTQNMGLWYNITNYTKPVNWSTSTGTIAYGTGSTAQRNALFSNSTYIYAVQLYNLDSSLFNEVLPLNKLGVQCYFDIYFAPANECIESDGTNPTYTVNNMQLHFASLVPTQGWLEKYDSSVSRGISYSYCAIDNISDTALLPAGISQANKILTFKYQSVIGLVMVMRPLSNVNSFSALDKLNNFQYNNTNVAYVKIGSQQYPINSNQSASDMLCMFADQFGLSMRKDFAAATNWISGSAQSFIVCIPLAKHIKEFEKVQNCSVDGLNTSIGTSINFQIQFSSPLGAAQQADFFCLSESSITFNPNGSITWTT